MLYKKGINTKRETSRKKLWEEYVMKIYALISEGYSDVVGFDGGKMIHWSKMDFAKDNEIIHQLCAIGKASKISHKVSPTFIRSLGDMLTEANVPFQTFFIQLSIEEVNSLNDELIVHKQYA